jgi:hypothetical protein
MSDGRMSNKVRATPMSDRGGPAILLMVAITAIIVASVPASAGTDVIPYDDGGSEGIPSAAAGLFNLSSQRLPGGCAYTFDIEAFSACWKAIYVVRMESISGSFAEALCWPDNWAISRQPAGGLSGETLVFYTTATPIKPGEVATGFGIISYSGALSLRWSPADRDGILLGKVSRLDLSCPLGTEPAQWGSIKSLYR